MLAVLALLWLRQVIHVGLLEEALLIEDAPVITCANCGNRTRRGHVLRELRDLAGRAPGESLLRAALAAGFIADDSKLTPGARPRRQPGRRKWA